MAVSTSQADPPDHEQRRLIETELDTTMLVEAAAGTGKTTSLMKRMVALLAEGRCRVGTLAAVTFTRKATAELRARFQVALENESRSARGERQARLHEALEHVEQCFIGTIHSFCGRLLRERPIEAGVDVAFEELDEDADFRLRQAAWDEFVAHVHAADDRILPELDELGLQFSDLKEAYISYANYPDVDGWPAEPAAIDEALAEEARGALRDYARHMQALAPTLPRHAGNDTLIPFFRELPRRLNHTRLRRTRELVAVLGDIGGLNVVLKQWPRGADQGRDERTRWRAFVDTYAAPLTEQWQRARYEPVLRVLRGAVAVYERMRAERGELSYQDLLVKAAGLLRGAPHVREYFRRRFTHLLVDEFQDTDPVQAEVMLLLTADDTAQRDWRRCRPDPGSLFVVGDPKQSIYRFRRADIVTYNEVRRIIEGCGRVVALTANFRSVPELIEWVNVVSADLFPHADDYSPADRPMQAARPVAGGCGNAGVRRLDVPYDKKAGVARYEADAIARVIRDALDRPLELTRTPGELAEGLPPHVTPGDFLVLTWRRALLTTYAQRLQRLGIPVEVTGGTAVNEIDEVALLHTALAAVVEADNPVALVGALRSELFGISDAMLYRFRGAGGAFNYQVGADERPIEGAEPIAEAFERLRRYARWLWAMQPVAAVERIAADLGLPARAVSAPGGSDRAGALCTAIELLRAAHRDEWTAAALVEYLWHLVDPDVRPQERHDGVPARPHDVSAVRVMNLHQAKGLEAPIVFLADGWGHPPREVNLHIDRRGGRVLGYLAVHGRRRDFGSGPVIAVPDRWPEHEQEEHRFLDAEHDRLRYVAATRAGVELVISRPAGKVRWEKLTGHVSDDDVLPVPPAVTVRRVETETLGADAPREFVQRQRARWETLRAATYGVDRVKALTVKGRAAPPAGEHGTEWGTVIHLLLEAAVAQPDGDLLPLAESALEEHELDRQRAGEAVALVRGVMGSELWRRAAAAPARMVEVPIQFVVSGTVETVVRGVIDLVFREPRGWVIVDYKTDDREGEPLEPLVAHYAPQVRMYAEAWHRLVEEPLFEAGLFFVRTGTYRAVELPAGGLAGV